MESRTEVFWKTRQAARALGVSPSTVKRWVDAGVLRATRTVGKHRLIARDDALRWARQQGLLRDDPAERGPEGAGDAPPTPEAARDGLIHSLLRGQQAEADRLIRAVCSRSGAVALGDGLIQPVMERIGADWADQVIDIFQEHRASRIVKLALIDRIRASQRRPGGPLALGAAPEGDPYILPGLLCELTLLEQGWEVMNLGVNLPLASLARAVQAHRPSLAWVSVSHLEDDRAFVRAYEAFHATASACEVAVVLGGRALTPALRNRLVAAGFGDRMAHLAEFARYHLARRGPAGGPPPHHELP